MQSVQGQLGKDLLLFAGTVCVLCAPLLIPKEKPIIETENFLMSQGRSQYSLHYFDKQQELLEVRKSLVQKPSIEEIYLKSLRIIVDEYNKYTSEIRKRRRLVRTYNLSRYIKIAMEYSRQVADLIERGKFELADDLLISYKDIEGMENAYESIEDITALQRKAVKELNLLAIKTRRCRPIPQDTLKLIFQRDASFIVNREYWELRLMMQAQQILPQKILQVIRNYQEDILYEQFGYEQQEISKYRDNNVQKLKTEMELIILQFDEDEDSVYSLPGNDTMLELLKAGRHDHGAQLQEFDGRLSRESLGQIQQQGEPL